MNLVENFVTLVHLFAQLPIKFISWWFQLVKRIIIYSLLIPAYCFSVVYLLLLNVKYNLLRALKEMMSLIRELVSFALERSKTPREQPSTEQLGKKKDVFGAIRYEIAKKSDKCRTFAEDVWEALQELFNGAPPLHQQPLPPQAPPPEEDRSRNAMETLTLKEDLQRMKRQYNSYKKERQRCDKQIHDLEEQVSRVHLNYTKQKQQMATELDKERQTFKQQIRQLQQQVSEYSSKCDQLQELVEEKALKIQQLQKEVEDSRNKNNNKLAHPANYYNAQIAERLEKIDHIKTSTYHLKREIADFKGTKADKRYCDLNEALLKNTMLLDKVDVTGHSLLKKKRKDTMKLVLKCQAELRNKE